MTYADYDDDGQREQLRRWELEALVEAGLADPDVLLDDAQVVPASVVAAQRPIAAGWHARDWRAIFEEPYVEPEALVPAMQIARGRPIGIIGPPGGGKNDCVQGLALAVTSGAPAYGLLPVTRRARVIHITYDMGDWATRIRYRRLANGMGLHADDVRDRLVLCPYPTVNLAGDDARREFGRLLKGFDLAILDNARAAIPGVNENDSQFGEFLTRYGQACQDAEAIGIYLHHSRKGGIAGLEAIRGSTAITGASGAIWFIDPIGGPESPRRVEQLREHDVSDGLQPPFWLRHDKLPCSAGWDSGPLAPIRLVGSLSEPDDSSPAGLEDRRSGLIVAAVKASPGLGANAVAAAVRGYSKDRVLATLRELVEARVIDKRQKGQQHQYYVCDE